MIPAAARQITELAPLELDERAVLELEPIGFRMIGSDARRLGFRAEALLAAGLPELVAVQTVPGALDEGEPVAIDLEGYVVVLHELVRRQAARLDELEARLEPTTGGTIHGTD